MALKKNLLIIKHGALGDFILSFGPFKAIRDYHLNDHIVLLTSSIFNIKAMDKNKIRDTLAEAEKESQNQEISDQAKYLVDHKIEVLKSLTLN